MLSMILVELHDDDDDDDDGGGCGGCDCDYFYGDVFGVFCLK